MSLLMVEDSSKSSSFVTVAGTGGGNMSTTETPQAPPTEPGRPFLLTGEGWPYLLVPLIPVAIVLEFLHADAVAVFAASAL
jgi:hypothetical protein